MADGSVAIVAFSSKFDELKPPVPGLVRGDTSTAGYILKPNKSSGGTDVHFLVEVRVVDHMHFDSTLVINLYNHCYCYCCIYADGSQRQPAHLDREPG